MDARKRRRSRRRRAGDLHARDQSVQGARRLSGADAARHRAAQRAVPEPAGIDLGRCADVPRQAPHQCVRTAADPYRSRLGESNDRRDARRTEDDAAGSCPGARGRQTDDRRLVGRLDRHRRVQSHRPARGTRRFGRTRRRRRQADQAGARSRRIASAGLCRNQRVRTRRNRSSDASPSWWPISSRARCASASLKAWCWPPVRAGKRSSCSRPIPAQFRECRSADGPPEW